MLQIIKCINPKYLHIMSKISKPCQDEISRSWNSFVSQYTPADCASLPMKFTEWCMTLCCIALDITPSEYFSRVTIVLPDERKEWRFVSADYRVQFSVPDSPHASLHAKIFIHDENGMRGVIGICKSFQNVQEDVLKKFQTHLWKE
jgi:hypothetical protein